MQTGDTSTSETSRCGNLFRVASFQNSFLFPQFMQSIFKKTADCSMLMWDRGHMLVGFMLALDAAVWRSDVYMYICV